MPPEQPQMDRPQGYHELPIANLAPKRKRSPLFLAAIIFVILAVAAAVVLAMNHHKKPASPQTSSQSKSQMTGRASVTHIDSTTKHYDSTNLFLGFDYPSDWSVTEPNSDKLTAISPALEIKSSGSQVIKARIVMTIQTAQSSISQFAANKAVAPIESQRLKYKSPTPSQRANTYLTAVNYAGGSSTIDAFYITGDNGYTSGQYVPQSDVVKDNPLITISFFACANSDCSNYGKPTSIATNAWADASLSKPLITMLQSLALD